METEQGYGSRGDSNFNKPMGLANYLVKYELRKLKQVVKFNTYPMPEMVEMFEKISSSTV